MAAQQLLIRLPEALARRLKRRVPARARSAFIQRLLEQALPGDEGEDDPLYQLALAVEHDQRLATEMADWDATIEDGSRRRLPRLHTRERSTYRVCRRARLDNARLMRLSGQLTGADLQAIEDGMRAVLVL